jgi:hypothetical protein
VKRTVPLHKARTRTFDGVAWLEWAVDERSGYAVWARLTETRKDPTCSACADGDCAQLVLRCDAWTAETVLHAQNRETAKAQLGIAS